ncbi:hypothetical protein NE237_030885 [Protea cynaroides]|uniref:Uncharacterized protein n=1 Tax=Protea cynaroides TaxID=273540 RepID=A0A9Q0GWS7_9MAGN|nr:hypothetical protein NE237_030885 [Protea cynaroides]
MVLTCDDPALKNDPPAKPFSSVLQPEMEFPSLIDDNDSKRQLLDGISSRMLGNKVVKENNTIMALEKLKEIHGSADRSLIEDILAAVNNNFDHAEPGSVFEDCIHTKKREEVEEDFPSGKMEDLTTLKAVLQGCLDNKKPEQTHESVSILEPL